MEIEDLFCEAAKRKTNETKKAVKFAPWFNISPDPISKPKKREKTQESELQDEIAILLNHAGYLVIRFNSSAIKMDGRYIKSYFVYGLKKSSGLSDLIVFKDGKCVFLEIKTKTGRQSESQKAFEEYVKSKKMQYYVINNLEDIKKLFKLHQ